MKQAPFRSGHSMGNSRAAGAIALFGSPFLTIVIYREAVKESGELTVRPRVTGRRYQGTVVVIQGEIQEKTGADVNGAGWAEMTGCDQHWCSSKHRQKGGCTVLLSPTAKSKWLTGAQEAEVDQWRGVTAPECDEAAPTPAIPASRAETNGR